MPTATQLFKLLRIIEEFRKLDPDIPTTAIIIFLYVAINEGCSQKEIGDAMGLNQPTTSRNVAMFTKMTRLRRPGFGLLNSREDLMNRRQKTVTLTPRGRKFLIDLKHILKGEI